MKIADLLLLALTSWPDALDMTTHPFSSDRSNSGSSRRTLKTSKMILGLTRRSRVLDVAAGRGTSAIFLANRFGCEIVGVDFSRRSVEEAEAAAMASRLSEKVSFQWADAEQLPRVLRVV